jgi:hypothetical protein
MKKTLVFLVFFAAASLAPAVAAEKDSPEDQLMGTWSGSWIPETKIRDSVTLEVRRNDAGKLTGKFLNPVSMDFSAASFDSKTRTLMLEAVDEKSGKQYRLKTKVEGNELKGTLSAGDLSGELHLIKWTYVPRIGLD